MENTNLRLLSEKMLSWYGLTKRDLPWRKTKDPYSIWVSEIMCQQTRVDTVISYYHRWMDIIPDVDHLAKTEDDVLYKLWQGLGYYNRVRNMKKAAEIIVKEHSGQYPTTKLELNTLPGIGDYTASAIASIAYEERVPVVDGNVLRVMSRVLASKEDISKNKTKEMIKRILLEVMPYDQVGDFNQSMMELGALVCIPNGRPKCEECPIRELCQGYVKGNPEDYPTKVVAIKKRIEERTVFLIHNEKQWLIRKRDSTGLLPNLWEYLNTVGHLSEFEAHSYLERFKLNIHKVERIGDAKHMFSHLTWKMKGYLVEVMDEEVAPEVGIFVSKQAIKETYSIPTAFQAFTKIIEQSKKE